MCRAPIEWMVMWPRVFIFFAPELGLDLAIPNDELGMLVVHSNGLAAEAGIRPMMLIVQANEYLFPTLEDIVHCRSSSRELRLLVDDCLEA